MRFSYKDTTIKQKFYIVIWNTSERLGISLGRHQGKLFGKIIGKEVKAITEEQLEDIIKERENNKGTREDNAND